MKIFISNLLWAQTFVLFLFSLCVWFSPNWKLSDLASNFPLFYSLVTIATIVFILFFARHEARLVPALILIAAMNLWALKPYIPLGQPEKPVINTADTLTILQTNLLRLNTDHSRILAEIKQSKADIVILSEVNFHHEKPLSTLKDIYPHHRFLPAANSYGMAVLSKYPFDSFEIQYMSLGYVPSFFFRITIQGQTVDLISIHPRTPNDNLRNRNEEFKKIINHVQKTKPSHLIITGDFNATPWNTPFRDMVKKLSLQNPRKNRGYMGSWPIWLPALARLPIDHTLHSASLETADFKLGDDIGSDHLPTLTVLHIKKIRPV